MLKSRKKIGLLSALTLLMCSVGTTAHADENLVLFRDADTNEITLLTEEELVQARYEKNHGTWWEYTKGEHGDILYECAHRSSGVGANYVVTDGSDLPEAFLNPSWAEDIDEWITYEEINPEDIPWTAEYQDWLRQYPETARVFRIAYVPGYLSPAKWEILVRRLALHYESVLDCFYYWEVQTGTTVWDGSVTFTLQRDADFDDFYPTQEEQAEIDALQAEYKIWYANYMTWLTTVDSETMTPAETEVSRKAAGLLSPYEITYKAYVLVDKIAANHSNVCEPQRCSAGMMALTSTPFEFYLENVFELTGDIDSDGEISSRDAAALLTAAAKLGTGEADGGLTDIQVISADINLDGKFDSSDSALLLKYAAQAGTGNAQSLKEFLKDN